MRSVSWKWWICCLLLLATMLNYMDRLTLNLTIVRIMHDFGLSVTEYARLESAFSLAFGAGALFFGWLADRWNVRLLYPLVVLAWSAAGFVTGLSWSFGSLLVCRFLLGLTEAGHWPCAIRTTQRILPAGERTMGNSLLQSGAALGSVLTPMVVLALVMEPAPWERPEWVAGAIGSTATSTAFGVAAGAGLAAWLVPVYQPGAWRYPFWVIGGLGIFWVAGWLISMRRTDWTGPAGSAAPAADPGCSPTLPKGLFWRRFLVLVVLVVSLNGTWHFFRVWLPLFFQREHGYSERAANVFFIGYYVAADLGSLAAGFLSLRLARRGLPVHVGRMVTFFLFACLTLLSLVAARLPAGPALWGVLWVIGFGALGCFPTYYSFTQELTTRHQGKVTGALGCLSWISMALLHEGVGKSVEMSGSSAHAVAWVGLAPLAAFLVIWLFWGRVPTTP